MRTLYAACLSRLGLSQTEAARLHDASLDTVKSWAHGRRRVPPGIWIELRAYEAEIVDRSESMREAWEAGSGDLVIRTGGDPQSLIAAADFVLTADDTAPVADLARAIADADRDA